MRHQDLRRPRGIESLWLRLRLAASNPSHARPQHGIDLNQLSDHLLEDVGLERREDGLGATSIRRRPR